MGRGIAIALVSGFAFAMSGPFGKPLLEAGWSPAGVVLVRVWIAALVTLIPMLVIGRARLATLRRAPFTVLAYGLLAVVAVQLAYFNAIAHMSVTVALLIEFSAPLLVLVYLWVRFGRRPSVRTTIGAVVAVAGLVAVVGAASGGAVVTPVGLAWAVLSLIGLAAYFLLAEDGTRAEDPVAGDAEDGVGTVDQLALAVGGLVVGALFLTATSLAGVTPVRVSTQPVVLGALGTVPWWVPAVVIGAVATGLAYVAGIVAINLVGPTLASFLGFSEVVASGAVAWLMLGEALTAVQIGGAVAIIAGIVVVKRGERPATPVGRRSAPPVAPASPPDAPRTRPARTA
ncbi:DMT family transporter [Tsukamurella sp. PLM1]|uniref:EamA family transporter n=1 Tax=Tsukamurella sp. PLM1 TaxID=2929795 RepID=UPI00204F9B2B|nr:DMT family transporter [Tsukamurella sp. PLM1]BDH57640.1 membrane protein [Tsukamurella sp. PLM1]